jgi:XTP/dITP diphosphohydrolase
MTSERRTKQLYLASGNIGKLNEYQALVEAAAGKLDLKLLPGYAECPEFAEAAPTFAENAVGKALYYSRAYEGMVIADDSGLVVPILGGAPGVLSARYAGPGANNKEKIAKLLSELEGKKSIERAAYFVCVIAGAQRGRALVVVSGKVDGEISEEPRGSSGFGYDPVFYFPSLGQTFAELRTDQKNAYSHRGKAFRRLMAVLD